MCVRHGDDGPAHSIREVTTLPIRCLMFFRDAEELLLKLTGAAYAPCC